MSPFLAGCRPFPIGRPVGRSGGAGAKSAAAAADAGGTNRTVWPCFAPACRSQTPTRAVRFGAGGAWTWRQAARGIRERPLRAHALSAARQRPRRGAGRLNRSDGLCSVTGDAVFGPPWAVVSGHRWPGGGTGGGTGTAGGQTRRHAGDGTTSRCHGPPPPSCGGGRQRHDSEAAPAAHCLAA